VDIEQAIYGGLSTDSTLSALVSTRVYPVQAPQGATFPLVIYSEAAQKKVWALGGPVNLNSFSLHLDCYATDYATAKAVRLAAKNALVGYHGTLGAGAITVRGIFDETSDDGVEAPIHADEFGVYRAGLDVSIYFGDT
jgi:hypothetical protein